MKGRRFDYDLGDTPFSTTYLIGVFAYMSFSSYMAL